MAVNRSAFDEAIANMSMQTSPYFQEYVFYMHLLAQCKITFTEQLPAVAGVTFLNDHYILYINPKDVIAIGKDGEEILGFTEKMPLQQRIGILKHEMLHIALGHLIRVKDGDKDFQKYNVASDCALDQEIKRDHLPSYAIYPDNNFPTKEKKVRLKESAEYYYSIIDDEEMQKMCQSGEGDLQNGEGNSGNFGNQPNMVGDHSVWQQAQGDPTLQQELTKNMVERAGNETQKSKGNLPSNYAGMVENLVIRREVDWKQVLRRIVGNKKANQRKTLLRRDRRLPHANWIKGRIKDRIFELGVVSDVSGSVSDNALKEVWGEIIHICELFNTPVQLVQVDTVATNPEPLNKSVKTIERKACGGTYLSPAIEKFKEAGTRFDALVITTDGYLYNNDIQPFYELNKPIIWLIEPEGQIMDDMNTGKMRAIKLS